MRQLGLTQRELASALRLTPGAISRFLAMGSTHARLRPERVEELVEILKRRLAELEEYGAKGTGESPGRTSALPLLSPETVGSLRVEVEGLLADEEEVGALLPEIVATPGGAMPVNASNYVIRAADREIDGILALGRSPANIVVAPINGGASSYLNRVYREAQRREDCWVEMVQMDAAFVEGQKFSQRDLFEYFFQRIGVPGLDGGNLDEEALKERFDSWAHVTWKEVSRAVLIVDGLDHVFRNARSPADPLALINWLNALRLEAALGVAPYTRLAVFLALTGRTWNVAHSSPYASQAASLYLRKFSREEVSWLFASLSKEAGAVMLPDENGLIDHVFGLFGGHPYLTQLFVHSLRNKTTTDASQVDALNLEGSYGTHWERMKFEIEYLVGDLSLNEVFGIIIDATTPDVKLSGDRLKLWLSYHRALRVMGLLDGTPKQPTLSHFYRTAMENETGMVALQEGAERIPAVAAVDA
jgi:transcriptional regulator with XRE-family HTH domain